MSRLRRGASHGRRAPRWLAMLGLLPLLAMAAADPVPADPAQAANAAFAAGRYRESAALFVQAAGPSDHAAIQHYNAACAFARAGDRDEAFAQLSAALDAGLDGSSPPDADPDLAGLHEDPRWAAFVARFRTDALPNLADRSVSELAWYFRGRRALARLGPGYRVHMGRQMFDQLYTFGAQFVGEYEEAAATYGQPHGAGKAIAAGYDRATPALPAVLAATRDRAAVFLNESHGQTRTRAWNYRLLAPLRAQGFRYLALETLATDYDAPVEVAGCSRPGLKDAALSGRGYAIEDSGYYTRDPVYAELVREALRLGYVPVAYEAPASRMKTQADREQAQADALACLFRQHPDAKLLVIAGFQHISESPDTWGPGGAMATRFRKASGIDPLSIDVTHEIGLDAGRLHYDDGQAPDEDAAYLLRNAEGAPYPGQGMDITLYVPPRASREAPGANWLALGGARQRMVVTASRCGTRLPCVIEARRPGERADAIAADRCVLDADRSSCTLFVPPGPYRMQARSDDDTVIAIWEQSPATDASPDAPALATPR